MIQFVYSVFNGALASKYTHCDSGGSESQEEKIWLKSSSKEEINLLLSLQPVMTQQT